MSALHTVWQFECGEYHVAEHEHLFGYDLVLSHRVEGRLLPIESITFRRQPDFLARRIARSWCMAKDRADWGQVTSANQVLCDMAYRH